MRTGFLGIMPNFSIPRSMKAGMAIGIARKIREDAVCITADFAQSLDLPIGSPVSGSLSSIPFSISIYLMNQLFANPPAIQATVLVNALSMTRRAPVALAEALALSCLKTRAMPTEEATAIA